MPANKANVLKTINITIYLYVKIKYLQYLYSFFL